jgi:hypothetical protein
MSCRAGSAPQASSQSEDARLRGKDGKVFAGP